MHGTTPRRRPVGWLGRGIAVAAALSVAVAGSAASVVGQEDLDVLKVGHTATITTWDPVKSFSTEALYMANMYEPLLYATPAGAEEDFVPALATDWSVSDDGLTWTFNLREGVTFHDGEPFNAEAAKASIDAARERAGASWIWWPVTDVVAVDDYTLDINLSTPAAVDLIAASTYAAWMVSPAALEAAAADEDFFEAAGQSYSVAGGEVRRKARGQQSRRGGIVYDQSWHEGWFRSGNWCGTVLHRCGAGSTLWRNGLSHNPPSGRDCLRFGSAPGPAACVQQFR